MSNQYKITITLLDKDDNILVTNEAKMTQDIILHLAKNHKIDGLQELFSIVKEQFFAQMQENQSQPITY